MKWAVSITLTLFFVLGATDAHAQIIISEVHANPLEGSEWVELFNNSNSTISLTGWKLTDTLTTPSTLFTFPELTLQSLETKVIEVSGQKLNNGGDSVELSNALGEILDTLSYSVAIKGLSWQKSMHAQTPQEANPTPGYQLETEPPSPTTLPSSASPSPLSTQLPTPIPTPNNLDTSLENITITQVQACPASGEQEWVQLHNNSTHTLDLGDAELKDAAANTIPLPPLLESQSTITITLQKSILNNTGETLTLTRVDGLQTKSFEIPACQVSSGNTTQTEVQTTPQQNEETPREAPKIPKETPSKQLTKHLQDTHLLDKNLYVFPNLHSHKHSVPQPSPTTVAIPIRTPLPKAGVLCTLLGGLLCSIAAAWYHYKAT